jgi:hypothetical protein
MLVLQDVVEIPAQPATVFAWFRNLESNYRNWHPDHVNCRYAKGRPFETGSVLSVQETLHGRQHKLRLKLTSIEPNRSIAYRIAPGLNGRFLLAETEFGCQLEAEIRIGWRVPIFGWVVDRLVRRVFDASLDALRIHMREEGQNLSRLLDNRAVTRPG